MNPIANDILALIGASQKHDEDDLIHYGTPQNYDFDPNGSGRYRQGSGENPFQHPSDFKTRVAALRQQGVPDIDIAHYFGYSSTTQLRSAITRANEEEFYHDINIIREQRAKGVTSPTEIGRILGKSESTVRGIMAREEKMMKSSAKVTADYLKEIVDEKGMIDVGEGVEAELNVSREKLNAALDILAAEGYPHFSGRIDQVTDKTGMHKTTQMVLCPPGYQHSDIFRIDDVHTVKDYDQILTDNGNAIRNAFEYPASMDSSRLKIRYAGDQGGELKDGVIELRPGVQDLSLGDAHYAQVRILVDGTHYLKGMAVYGDPNEMPKGVDVIFNTNKKEGTPALGPKDNSVLKPIEKDADNPFGSTIKEKGGQSYYDDPKGKFIDPETGHKQSLSLINKRSDQDDWNEWKDTLATQFLSKQPIETIKKQLDLSKADKLAEFEEIMSYTNPTVKRKLLADFASKCDGNSVDLKAAAFPDQKYKVILPVNSLKDNEVYAPYYKDGQQLALIRYPHAGLFEIPILKVNNKNAEGDRMITKEAGSAIGITKKVADVLSGADFDGDTVMVIPLSDKVRVQNRPRTGPDFESLNNFDSKQYKHEGNYPRLKKGAATEREMGQISNLITDMTLLGAPDAEIVRAVKHSMVVIDAAKHGLDYRQSYRDNGIKELQDKYMGRYIDGHYTTRAATLISAAKGQKDIPRTKGSPRINQKGKPWYDPNRPEGALIYKQDPGRFYVDRKTGKTIERTIHSTNMAQTDDARTLISPARHQKEIIYADYANFMKDLANKARMAMVETGRLKYSASARNIYEEEWRALDAQLKLAKQNKPRERAAQRLAASRIQAKKQAFEQAGLTKQEYKSMLDKERQRALTDARNRVSARRHQITFTPKQWQAVQAGAISDNKLTDLLKYADMNNVKSYALPKRSNTLTVAQQNKIKAMRASGYSIADIAAAVGCSKSTVSNYT